MNTKKEPTNVDPTQIKYSTPQEISEAFKETETIFNDVAKSGLGIVSADLNTTLGGYDLEFNELNDFFNFSEYHTVTLTYNNHKRFTHKAHFDVGTIRFYIFLDADDVQEFRKLFGEDYKFVGRKRDVYSMSVKELIESGASIDIRYHSHGNISKNMAKEIVNQFEKIGDEDKYESGDINWIQVSDDNVEITAFYEEEKNERDKS